MNTQFMIVIALTVAVNTGMGLIVPILPTFLQEFGYSVSGLSLPFFSLIVGRMISKSFAARVIGLLRNKLTLVISFILYSLTFLAYTLVDSAEAFVALRFFEGIVEGISIICLTDLAIVLSKENRGQLMGIFGASFGIGFILGPLIGGVCYELWGTAAMFYAGTVLGLLAAFASLFVPSIDTVPTQKKQGWLNTCLEHASYLPEYGPNIIRRAVFFSFMILLPLYTTREFGINASQVAIFFTISAVISASLMPFTGKLADRFSTDKILSISLPFMALLIAAFGFVNSLQWFACLFILESLCFAFMLPAGMKVFADSIDDHPQRTSIISGFGGLTEAFTLILALILPSLYLLSAQAAWLAVAAVCGLAASPFIRRLINSPPEATVV